MYFLLDDDECNIPLLDRAQLTATTSLPERGPQNARLNGKKMKCLLLDLYSSHLFLQLNEYFLHTILYYE